MAAQRRYRLGGSAFPRPYVSYKTYLLLTFFRLCLRLFRHPLLILIISISLYLWIAEDWIWYLSFLIFPSLLLLLLTAVKVFYLWYRNPTVPIFARKQ